jgi:hypothetical protein
MCCAAPTPARPRRYSVQPGMTSGSHEATTGSSTVTECMVRAKFCSSLTVGMLTMELRKDKLQRRAATRPLPRYRARCCGHAPGRALCATPSAHGIVHTREVGRKACRR